MECLQDSCEAIRRAPRAQIFSEPKSALEENFAGQWAGGVEARLPCIAQSKLTVCGNNFYKTSVFRMAEINKEVATIQT